MLATKLWGVKVRKLIMCDMLPHSHVPNRTPNDGDQLSALKDDDAGLTASQDTEDLRGHSDSGHKSLYHEGGAGPEPLGHPAGHKEVDGAAEGGAHAQNRELCRGSGSDLVAAAPVAGAFVWWVIAVEDVALHQVEDVEYSFRLLSAFLAT
jgi:hypothetical protein